MIPKHRWKGFLLTLSLAFTCSMSLALAREKGVPSDTSREPVPAVDYIVKQLELKNRERASELLSLEGTRVYRMHYEGFFGTRDAEMVAAVNLLRTNENFTIESQSDTKSIKPSL